MSAIKYNNCLVLNFKVKHQCDSFFADIWQNNCATNCAWDEKINKFSYLQCSSVFKESLHMMQKGTASGTLSQNIKIDYEG